MTALNILLVEDNDDHAELLLDSLQEFNPSGNVMRLASGEEALELIAQPAANDHRGLPDVILLDLNMPRYNGIDVLRRLKSHQDWCKVPVFILTTSSLPNDMKSCYQIGANGYFCKPLCQTDYLHVVSTVTSA